MKFHTIPMSMFLALSITGCAAEDGGLEPETAEPEVCQATGAPCGDDSICGDDSCEPAFDRAYRVGVKTLWVSNTKQLELCDEDPSCGAFAAVDVYFSELADPILFDATLASPPAQIVITEGSYLVVDLGQTSCVIDLTAPLLSGQRASCAGSGTSVSLSLEPL